MYRSRSIILRWIKIFQSTSRVCVPNTNYKQSKRELGQTWLEFFFDFRVRPIRAQFNKFSSHSRRNLFTVQNVSSCVCYTVDGYRVYIYIYLFYCGSPIIWKYIQVYIIRILFLPASVFYPNFCQFLCVNFFTDH